MVGWEVKRWITLVLAATVPLGIILGFSLSIFALLNWVTGYRTFCPLDPPPGYSLARNQVTGEWRYGRDGVADFVPYSFRFQAVRNAWREYDARRGTQDRAEQNWKGSK